MIIQITVKSASDNYSLSINEYESIFSLKQRLKDKIDFSDRYLLFAGKVLDDNFSLYHYELRHGSIVYLENELQGGNLLNIKYLLLVLLIFAIMSFFTLLVMGVVPVLANIFYFMIKFTLDYLGGIITWIWGFIQTQEREIKQEIQMGERSGQIGGAKFNLENAKKKFQDASQAKIDQTADEKAGSYNFLTWIYDTFLFFLKHGITLIFVYTISAILIIPIFFYRTQDRCKSLNLGHYVGLTVAIIYFLFYGVFLNTIDGIINTYFFFSGLFPRFLRFLPDFVGSMVKDSWDEAKLTPYYSIPIIGQVLMVYHEAIESGLIYLKEFLDQEAKYGCETEAKYRNIQDVLSGLVYKNRRNDRGGYVEHIGRSQPGDNYMTSMVREFIKDFKLQPTVELVNIGFNEELKCQNQFEGKPFFEKIFSENYWDCKSSGSVKAVLCFFLKLGGATNAFIDDMNGPLAVANMIKTGNIAGIFTSFAYFIIIILAFLLSSMYGVQIANP